jgi:hypothetical protein
MLDMLLGVHAEDSRLQFRFLLHSDEAPQALHSQCPWVGIVQRTVR